MVVFLRTRHKYDSYQDFWRLVELSGFQVIYLDEIDLGSEHTYIFTPHNGQLAEVVGSKGQESWLSRRCKIIWWYLERPEGHPCPFEESLAGVLPWVDVAWTSDQTTAAMHPAFTFAVLGGHPGLNDGIEPSVDKKYDFAHMSYAWGRREDLYKRISDKGLRVASCVWGRERSEVLARTRLLINAHQYPLPIGEPLRMAIAAANRIAVLSETIASPFPLEPGADVWMADISSIPDVALQLLQDQARMDKLALALHERLCVEWTFRRGVEDAVARSSR